MDLGEKQFRVSILSQEILKYTRNRPVSYSRPHWGEWRKTHKVRLMRGRNESTRAVAMANHTVLLLTAFETYLELANVTFFSIPSGQGE